MKVTIEDVLEDNVKLFSKNIKEKIQELCEEYPQLSDEEINCIKYSYVLTFDTHKKGIEINFERTKDISPEIDEEIDSILNSCAEKCLK